MEAGHGELACALSPREGRRRRLSGSPAGRQQLVAASPSTRRAPLLQSGMPQTQPAGFPRVWRRHFASKQLAGDRFGTCVGACLYLSLVPSLAALRRADLCAGAVGCACITLWPHLLSSKARRFYIATRDYLIALQ